MIMSLHLEIFRCLTNEKCFDEQFKGNVMELSIHPSTSYRLHIKRYFPTPYKAVRNLLPLHKPVKNGSRVINSFLVDIRMQESFYKVDSLSIAPKSSRFCF